jgi:hypothetical protein
VGGNRGSKETDGCPLTLSAALAGPTANSRVPSLSNSSKAISSISLES